MNIDFLHRLLLFIALLLAQVLVLNHIHLFNIATPLLYIYLVISFRRNYPKWGMLVWSFLLGLCVDIFSNTPGVAAASMTLMAFLQPFILELFVQRDSDEDLRPCIRTLNLSGYLYYVILITLNYCLVFFTIETFNFFNWTQWGLSILGSTALSVVLIVVVDNLRKD
jgi:rod shape-determining protein MreD